MSLNIPKSINLSEMVNCKGTTVALNDVGNPPLLVVTPSADDYQLRPAVFVCSIATLAKNLSQLLK